MKFNIKTMKKLILLCIMLLLATLASSQTRRFNEQIQLTTVPETTTIDSIVVQDSGNLLKKVKYSTLLSKGVTDITPTIIGYQQLTETFIDSYNGTRLTPKNLTLNGFEINKSVNGSMGFSAVNIDNSGNGAFANISVRGVSPTGVSALYTYVTGITQFNAGYWVPYLRNSGALQSDTKLHILTTNNNDINFMTGATIDVATSKFIIKGTGQLTIGVEPTLDNTVTKIIGRKTDGSIITLDKSSIITGLVPYTGATNNLTLGSNTLTTTSSVTAGNFRISALNTAPSSATDIGTLGEIRVTSTHIYICIATNTWVRTALTTW